MNRFINAFLLFLLLPTMLVSIYVGFDLPLSMLKTNGADLPYREYIFLTLGLIVFVVNLRRSVRRWMGQRIVSKQEKFRWNHQVSNERARRVNTYLLMEVVVFSAIAIGLYLITPEAWMPAAAYGFTALDNLIFAVVGKSGKKYRVGLSSKALVIADRDVIVLYFTGLRKVSIHQQTIYFDYIKGLQLSFPSNCIDEDQRKEFFETLEDQFDKDRVFVTKKF